MKEYSVKEVAEILNTNPETVRRWIRSGKLKSDISSRKDGNVIHEDELYKYLRTTAKYSSFAAAMLATNPLLALTTAVSAGVVGAMVSVLAKRNGTDKKQVQILSEDVKRNIQESIAEGEELIRRKQAAIAELQIEIEKQQRQVEDYRLALKHFLEIEKMELTKGEMIDG